MPGAPKLQSLLNILIGPNNQLFMGNILATSDFFIFNDILDFMLIEKSDCAKSLIWLYPFLTFFQKCSRNIRLKLWGLKIFCMFWVDVASVGRFPIWQVLGESEQRKYLPLRDCCKIINHSSWAFAFIRFYVEKINVLCKYLINYLFGAKREHTWPLSDKSMQIPRVAVSKQPGSEYVELACALVRLWLELRTNYVVTHMIKEGK